jgi:MarR family transcriptional regulator, lower aerobic nicotinate degradation pathway regulator
MPRHPAPVSPLEAHLGYWLRFVSNHVSHAFSRALATRDVTAAEWVVLRELYDHDTMVPSDLAAKLGMTRGAISKLADRLTAKSLVAQTASQTDRRYQALALTSSGRALVPELSTLADANDAAFFGHLAPAERTAIEAAMQDIVRRLHLRGVPVS